MDVCGALTINTDGEEGLMSMHEAQEENNKKQELGKIGQLAKWSEFYSKSLF